MTRRVVRSSGYTLLLAAISFVLTFPVVLTVLNSFRSTSDIVKTGAAFPTAPTLANYATAWESDLPRQLLNSCIASVGATALAVPIGLLAGYALSRFGGRLMALMGDTLVALQMVPVILVLIPLFGVASRAGLVGTLMPLIPIYAALLLPVSIWMFSAMFDAIPRELEEACWIDGASRFRGLVSVMIPLSAPSVAAISTFITLLAYHDYLIAVVFLRSPETLTVPIGLQSFAQQNLTDWGPIMASTTIAMLPSLAFLFIVQRYMTTYVSGALKG